MWRYEFDAREPKNILQSLHKAYPDAIIHNCDAGDYNCYWLNDDGTKSKWLRIESKTVSDLMHSATVEEGDYIARLWRQLAKMQDGDQTILLLKGAPSAEIWWESRPIDFKRYVGIITAVAKSRAVILPIADNIRTVVEAVKAVFELHQVSGGRFYPAVRPFRGIPWQQGALSVYPGIGGVKAEKLYNHFSSFDELIRAAPEELRALLGRSAGQKLYEGLHGKWRDVSATPLRNRE